MASGNTKPMYQLEGLSLVVRGFILDAIDGLGGNENFELIQPSETVQPPPEDANKSSEWALDCLRNVLRCLVLGRRDRYLQDAAIPKEFIADFLKFCSKAMQNKNSEIPTDFRPWFDRNHLLRIRGCTLETIVYYATLDEEWISESENRISVLDPQAWATFTGRFFDAVVRISRRLMVSKKGFLGMAPNRSRKGDIVCILFGCSVPVVLRKAADGTKYVFIGECYVDGYMAGEAVGDDRFQETNFCIS
jgi:hypothetical protein